VATALGGFIIASPIIDWWGERKERNIKSKYDNMLKKLEVETEKQKGKIYAQTCLLVTGSLEWHYPEAVNRTSPL